MQATDTEVTFKAGTNQIDLDKLAGTVPETCEILAVQWSDGTSLTAEVCEGAISGASFDESTFDVPKGFGEAESEWMARELGEIPDAREYLIGDWAHIL